MTGLDHLLAGDRIWFAEERMPYTVQARDARFLVCTKPFAARRTVIYTIVDLQAGIRGPDDRVFCEGYETREDCERALRQLNDPDDGIDVSARRSIKLRVAKVLCVPAGAK